MVAIYTPLGAEGYELCHPVDADDFETFNTRINGELRGESWQTIRVELIGNDQGKELAYSDSPWLGAHALIFRPAAVEKLGLILSTHGELLPLSCADARLWVFNPTHVLDALDEDASSAMRFSTGRIMWVTKYVFRVNAIVGVDVFKIPNLRVSPTFVSERFVRAWDSAGLRGLTFKQVWSG